MEQIIEKIIDIKKRLNEFKDTKFWDDLWCKCVDYIMDLEAEGPFDPNKDNKHCHSTEKYSEGKWEDEFEIIIEKSKHVLQEVENTDGIMFLEDNEIDSESIKEVLQTIIDNLCIIVDEKDNDENEDLLDEAIRAINAITGEEQCIFRSKSACL